jgi:sugar phosphate permease
LLIKRIRIKIQGWRGAFLVAGIPGFVLALVIYLTGEDPPRSQRNKMEITENKNIQQEEVDIIDGDLFEAEEGDEADVLIKDGTSSSKSMSNSKALMKCLMNPAVILLLIGACVRQAGKFKAFENM